MKSLALLLLTFAVASCDRPAAKQRNTAAAPSIALTGRVTDAADIIDPALEARLTARLEALEQRAGHQFVVVTASSLNGRGISSFTRELANDWGIGRAKINDGVVLLIAPNERKVRIAVGDGLAKALTNAACQQIIDRDMIPRFKVGDLPGGIEAGADALIARLQ